MQVLVTNCAKSYNLITKAVELNELSRFRTSSCYDLMITICSLTDKVNWCVPNFKTGHRYKIELNLFVHQVHGCVKASLNVVFDIIGSQAHFLHESRAVGASTCSEEWRLQFVMHQRESNVSHRSFVISNCKSVDAVNLTILN